MKKVHIMFNRHFTSEQVVTISKTIIFISQAHAGQKYGTEPYYLHPIAVAQMIGDDATFSQVIVGLMHDVVEDTTWSLNDVRTMFGNEIAHSVSLVTKDNSLSYRENIQRIIDSGDIDAIKVKLADNCVNIGGDKSQMPEDRKNRLIAKYTMSIEMLLAALADRP
jgi:guanosine-3',5'-bis(diphosphate) 3'-pyrophosphohydrolase